jgi:DNA polymerase-4
MRILPKPEKDAPTVEWLFLDLNSYFASVEQQERPELRGRPVGVVPLITDSTCCIAASYEAKAYGVRTGTGVLEARTLCPHIELVEARPKLYVEYHHRIIDAVNNCLPVTNVMSVDEMAIRLMGRERAVSNATQLSIDLKTAIRSVGETLRCSVGLAPNRYLAKLASDMLKPDGLTVLLQRDLPRVLFRLNLRDLIGVSHAMEKRINNHGIMSVEQLCRLSPEQMRKVWGSVLGERMWHWLRGADFNDPESERKSIGHQHVLGPEYRTRQQAFQVSQKLLQHAAARLRKLNLWAGGIGAYVRFMGDVEPWKAQRNISECQDSYTLQLHLTKLWESCPDTKPLQAGVWLFNLMPDEQHTLSLFDDNERQCRISAAIDALNDRYGQGAVYFASMQSVLETAPTRIGFTSIPDLKEF